MVMAVIYEPSERTKRFYGIFLLILGILLFIYGLTMISSIYEWKDDRWIFNILNLFAFLSLIILGAFSMLFGLKLLKIIDL